MVLVKDSLAVQNIESLFLLPSSNNYTLSRPLLKKLFIKNYPASPKTLGEKIRKARMDAGLQIKDLALMIGVSKDSIMNWEGRGIKPAPWSLEKAVAVIARLGSFKR
jgi:DNA-binding transcriptional regulator YiaG